MAGSFSGRGSGFDQRDGGLDFIHVERLPAGPLALALAAAMPLVRSEIRRPLEMSDGAEDIEGKFAGGRGGVDFLLEAEQRDLALRSRVTVVTSSASDRASRSRRTIARVSPGRA